MCIRDSHQLAHSPSRTWPAEASVVMADPRKRRRQNRTGTPRRGGPARLPELHIILSAQVKHLLVKSDPELRQILRQHHRMVAGLLASGRVTQSTSDTNIKQLVNLGR